MAQSFSTFCWITSHIPSRDYSRPIMATSLYIDISHSGAAHQNRYIIHRYLACPLHFPRLMSGATSRPKISLRESTSSDPDPSLWKPSKNCSNSRANLSYLEPIPSPAAQVGGHPQNSHQEKRGRLSGGGRHRLSLRTTSDIYLSPSKGLGFLLERNDRIS